MFPDHSGMNVDTSKKANGSKKTSKGNKKISLKKFNITNNYKSSSVRGVY